MFCITFALTALYLSVESVMEQQQQQQQQGSFEKSTAVSGSGFHLLSCPKLFKGTNTGTIEANNNGKNKYSDIRLSKESTEKLMTMLKDSLQHAHVFHAGGTTTATAATNNNNNANSNRAHRTIANAVEGKIGNEHDEVDINIPRKTDNNSLCAILETILDEQIESNNNNNNNNNNDAAVMPSSDNGDQHVTISIMKLDSPGATDSVFLRGARLVRNTPIVDSVFKMTNLDEGLEALLEKAKTVDLEALLEKAKKVDLGATFRGATAVL